MTQQEAPTQWRDVLLVEDDERVVEPVRDGLARRRVRVHHAPTLAEAERYVQSANPVDVIVLDLNLPDGNGVNFAQDFRNRGHKTPIIMVTARDAIADRVTGLRHGADDYVCKPFSVEELAARIEAVLRRVQPASGNVLRYADIEVDLLKRQVRRGETEVSLSGRELDLLAYFMMHPDEVLEKARILRDVWGDDAQGDDNLLQVYANYLRNKLEQGIFPRLIHTIRGVGYVLAEHGPPA